MKTRMLLIVMFALSFSWLSAQLPGSTCENPLNVDPFNEPLVNFAINSETYGNDYTSTMVTPSTSYLNGNDIVFQFSVAAKSYIYSSIQGAFTGLIFVGTCPNSITPAPRLAFAGGSQGATVATFTLDPGTYFMIASTWPPPNFTDMVINFSAVPVPLEPSLVVTPSELFTGWAVPGVYSVSKTLTLSNQGAAEVIIMEGGFAFTGTNPADYSVSLAAGDVYPLVISFGQNKVITLTFNPSVVGNSTANLEITYNNIVTPVVSVPLSGLGYEALSTFSQNFDEVSPVPTGWLPDGWGNIVQAGNTTANVNVRTLSPFSPPNQLTFASGADLAAQLFLISPYATNFSNSRVYFTARMGSSTHTGKLQVGYLTSRTDPATFVSAAEVSITGSWQLYSVSLGSTGVTFPENAYIGIRYVPEVTNRMAVIDDFIYELVPTQPIFNANKINFDFGNTTWMYESSTQLLQIYNSGVGQLRINESGVQLAGADPSFFTIEYPQGHTWPIALGFGQAINLTIRFSPLEGRAYNALLNITDNVTGKAMNTITLAGTGYDAMIEPGFLFDFTGTFPPNDWRRFIGLLGVEPITPTTNTSWSHRKFANETTLPANNSAGVDINGTSKKHWLMAPPVNLGDGSQNYQLEFDLAMTANNSTNPVNMGAGQKFAVVISTDGGQTWSTDNILQLWDATTSISNTGERIFINLTGYTGRVIFGFYAESTVTGGDVDLFFRNVAVNEFVPLVQLPFSEDFESRSFPPQNWSGYNVDGFTPEWALSTDYNHTSGGTKSAFHAKGAAGEPQDGWMVTPLLQIPAQGPILLKFWSLNNFPADYGKNSVWVSTGSSNPADEDFTEVWTDASVSQSWVETTIDLTAYTNQTLYVGFRYEGTFAHDWFIDDVHLFVDTSPIISVTPEVISRSQVAGVTSQSVISVTNNGIDNLIYDIVPEYLSGGNGWLSSNPASGNVQGGGFTQNHSIGLNSAGLNAGIHTANLHINSNDPENPVVTVFVTLTVNESTIVQVKTLINEYTYPLDLSQDGKYVLLTGFGGGSGYLWSDETGLKSVTGTQISVQGVSDAGIVSGSFKDPAYLYNGNMVQVSGTWDPATEEWTFLGMNPDAPVFFSTSYQTGYGITADGQMSVGMQYLAPTVYKAFKWTTTSGYSTIGASYGYGNRPNGVNKSGSVIFGWAQTATFSRSPAIWTDDVTILLSPTTSGEAYAATPSGNYVTGSSGSQGFLRSADGQLVLFSNKLDPAALSPTTVLEDGTIFGFYGTVPTTLRRAFVRYTDDTQISFNDYAIQRGLADAYDWIFYSINNATPDGTKFIGAGVNPQGQNVSFLIDFDVEVPVISINPEELNETLAPGQTSSQVLTIENIGTADLDYTAIIINQTEPGRNSTQQVPEGIIQPKGDLDLSIARTNGGDANSNRSGFEYVLHYDGANTNALGLTAGGEFSVAARYPADMVYLLEGSTIQSVDFYVEAAPTSIKLRIWGPGTTTAPGTLLFERPFTPVGSSWNTITLDTPFEITGEDIWIGFHIESGPQVWVAGMDGGPVNPNGDFITNDGINWERISNYGYNGNWNIRSLLQLPNIDWISINPNAGTLEPGLTENIQVSFDANGFDEGIYNANIVVFSNDPQNEISFVPVELTVEYPEANILSYAFNTTENPSLFNDAIGQVDLLNHSVTLEVPQNADLSGLIATFTLSDGVIATVGTVTQVSAITPNDFTTPVVYTLSAGTRYTQDWTVTVNTLPCLSPWTYLVTGSAHTINIPLTAAPEIFGVPLAPLDWIGVFYLNDDGEETCGGAVQWNGEGNVAIIAYGNDPTTPEKDGFASGETFRWRLSQCGNPMEYTAVATYDPMLPNQGNFASFGLSKLTSLKAAYIQYYTLNEGWNSISSYLNPIVPAVEYMFSPIVNNLTILSNLTSVYWPSQGVNSIGNWNSNSGYVVKMTEDAGFMIGGADFVSGTLTIPAGWSYLPVLSECPAEVMELFGSNLADVVIIQELIGTGVFWPAFEINTIGHFQPGKAYVIKLLNPVTVTFPECSGFKVNLTPATSFNSMETGWGTIKMTPYTQSVIFLANSLVNVSAGDMIGAFDESGKIWGFVQINSNNQNQTITLFGDDFTTQEKNGFAAGESISFKLMRAQTGEVIDLEVEYDQFVDNASGTFLTNSVSAVTNVTLLQTGIDLFSGSSVQMYPNPARDVLNFSINGAIEQNITVEIYDNKGVAVARESFSNNTVLNISHLAPGVYFVNIRTTALSETRKLVIR